MGSNVPWVVDTKALGASKVRQAYEFAHKAHQEAGQRRKYTNEPYIVHPHEVASIVSGFGAPPEALMAAYLHDVVEDTSVTFKDIEEQFGPYVASLVEQLTDISKPTDGNRVQRKALDHAHSARASYWAQVIKCADIYSNVKSISAHDPQFAVTYIEEKLDQLRGLEKAPKELSNFLFKHCEHCADAAEQALRHKRASKPKRG